MFWGKGDSSKLGDSEKTTLAHIRRMTETGHIIALNAEQSETVLRALDWYEAWEGAMRVAKGTRNVLVLAAFFLGIWWATEGAVLDFLGKVGGQ